MLIFAFAIFMHQKFDKDQEITYLKVVFPFALFLLVSSFSYFYDAFWGYDLRKKYLFGTEGRLRKGVIVFELLCTFMFFCFLLSTFSLMDDLRDEEKKKKLNLTEDKLLSNSIIAYTVIYIVT
jgi:hypothetical protein